MVIFQIIAYTLTRESQSHGSVTTINFMNAVATFVEGGLAPLIVRCLICRVCTYSQSPHRQAIYPTIIIILISLNRSYTDKDFISNVKDVLPTPPIQLSLIREGPREAPQQYTSESSFPDVSDIHHRNPRVQEAADVSHIQIDVQQKMKSSYVT